MNGALSAWKIAAQWVEKAEHDLRNAEHTLTLAEDCPFDTVCFHAHQCVEKYLKAGLTAFGTEFPRTHDLTELHVLLPQAIAAAVDITDLAELNPYAVRARYPGPWEPQTREDANRAVEVARRVRESVRAGLPTRMVESRKEAGLNG